jgi:hypothetical protein
MCMEPASISDIEDAVNRVLAMKRRTPKLVVDELGPAFVEQHQHLTTMLCEKDVDLARLMRLLDMARSVHAGKLDQNDASEEVGLELAIDYVDAVRLANGKRRRLA